MKPPFVGPPVTVQDDRCAFAPDLDQPKCGQRAITHLVVRSVGWGVVGLATCADHEQVARLSGEVLNEHPYDDPCQYMTGECWG